MASQKTIVIEKIETRLVELADDGAIARVIEHLHTLGAPQSLIDGAADSRTAMREELPRMLEWVRQNARSHHSRNTIMNMAGAAGFSPEALFTIL